MRWILGVAVVAAMLAGCREGEELSDRAEPSAAVAECTPEVRFQGTIYRAWVRSPQQQATKLGMADDADCDDIGCDAAGAYFSPNPRQVDVWAFEGLPVSDVIGVSRRDGLHVYVAENVPNTRAARIANKLDETPH